MHKLKIILFLLSTCIVLGMQAQNSDYSQSLDFGAGGTFGKVKGIYAMNKIALGQVSVTYKQISTKTQTVREKKFGGFGKVQGKAATGSVTAYLETTDGELMEADYQEITDHFYQYFQQRLKSNGIEPISWTQISTSEFYQSFASEKTEEENKDENAAQVTYRANKGHKLYGTGRFAMWGFPKMKKAGKFCDETGSSIAAINVVVDFSDIDVQVGVSAGGAYKSTWTPTSQSTTTTMSSKTNVAAVMRVTPHLENEGNSLFINGKLQAENVYVNASIPAEMTYAEAITEDPSKAEKRNAFFRVGLSKKLESTPVVISTTKAKYKLAAKKALENYVDAFIAKTKLAKG